jgi:hypothetical protein
MGTCRGDVRIFISLCILLRMINFSDRSCTENQITHLMFSKRLSENRAVYEILWKNMVEQSGPQMTI